MVWLLGLKVLCNVWGWNVWFCCYGWSGWELINWYWFNCKLLDRFVCLVYYLWGFFGWYFFGSFGIGCLLLMRWCMVKIGWCYSIFGLV